MEATLRLQSASLARAYDLDVENKNAGGLTVTLEQHLPFADQRAVQNQRIEQLDARTKQAEQVGLADAALSLRVEQGQAKLGRIGGENPQPQPERLSRNTLVDQAEQFGVERIEDIGKQVAARLRESAGG